MDALKSAVAHNAAPFDQQELLEKQTFAQPLAAQSLAAGVFPVAFDVPATGQLFRFGQVMVVGQAPQITMIFLRKRLVQSLISLLLIMVVVCLMIHRYRLKAAARRFIVWAQNVPQGWLTSPPFRGIRKGSPSDITREDTHE